MEILGVHEYATQPGNEWATYDFVTTVSAQANDEQHATFNINGQILSQLSYYGLMKNNQMTCLDFTDTGNSNSKCPILDLTVQDNNNLQCVYGAGFNNTNNGKENSFAIVIVNACTFTVNLQLKLDTMIDKVSSNIVYLLQ